MPIRRSMFFACCGEMKSTKAPPPRAPAPRPPSGPMPPTAHLTTEEEHIISTVVPASTVVAEPTVTKEKLVVDAHAEQPKAAPDSPKRAALPTPDVIDGFGFSEDEGQTDDEEHIDV